MKKTYLLIWFNSEGMMPSMINDRLLNIGFKPENGYYDYVYEWDEHVTTEDILKIGDKIKDMLQGSNVLFKLESTSTND